MNRSINLARVGWLTLAIMGAAWLLALCAWL